MDPVWVKVFGGAAVAFVIQGLILGGLGWAIKAWINSVNANLNRLAQSVHGVELYMAKYEGMSKTQISELKKDIESNKERVTLAANKAEKLHERLDSIKKQNT